MMKAVLMDSFGGPEVLSFREVPRPELRPRDVLIQVAYAGVNPADWKEREGALADADGASLIVPGRQYEFPSVLGLDASGTIAEVGSAVTDWQIGDRVVTVSDGPGKWGTYAEYVAVRSDHVAPMPVTLDFAAAAAYPVAATTGWQALFAPEKGALKTGDSVLIHGAAGGVGSYAVQFARARGLRVSATCRLANADYVRSLGADHTIDFENEDVVAALHDWAPNGVDVLLDLVGAGSLPDACATVRNGGKWISVATIVADGDIERDREAAALRGVEKIFAVMDSRGSREQLIEIGDLIDSGLVVAPPLTSFPISEAVEAHRMIEKGHLRGKLVLHVADLDGLE